MKLPSFVRDLSLSPVEYHAQARLWSRQMREEAPIIWDDDSENWLVFRYDDVIRVQSDYHTFSSENTVPGRFTDPKNNPNITEMDPPRHQQMRSLITQAFSARTIAEMAPQIEQMVDELLAGIIARGSCDWMADLANPLPVMVIANMLGLPAENWREFKAWSDSMIEQGSEQMLARRSFSQYFAQIIAQHRLQPSSDILSLLMASEVEGERLHYIDLIVFCFTLFLAGNITTTNVLGNAMLCFDQHPAALERLRQQPDLLPSAIEEVLRYMPPFRAGPSNLSEGRVAKEDVMLSGQLVRQGERVRANRLSANFDERHFSDPERFDIGRTPNRHQSFGHGIHFCIGAPLARLEIRTALERALKQFPALHIMPGVSLQQAPSMGVFGVKHLPMTFNLGNSVHN